MSLQSLPHMCLFFVTNWRSSLRCVDTHDVLLQLMTTFGFVLDSTRFIALC